MKNFVLIISFILASFNTVFAQEVDIIDSLTQTPQEQFEHITENLDLTAISSGLLANKAFLLYFNETQNKRLDLGV